MKDPIQIRMGGYGPPTTTCSRGLKVMGKRLERDFGKTVDVRYIWNVMDLGYKGSDLLWMAEHGILTLSYQSTSYLADRVPELELADLPFLFDGLDDARAAMDGKFGAWLSARIEERIPGYRILGYFENGYRHLSNRLRPVRAPADLKGMKIRLMPGRIHARSFELQGAVPFSVDIKEGLEAIMAGKVDAQENPFANTVDYGAHKAHRFHTMTGHCYLSRGIYLNRAQFESWPHEFQQGIQHAAREAIAAQRALAVEEEDVARKAIEAAGGEILELTRAERAAFAHNVKPLHDEARKRFGAKVFALIQEK